MQDLALIAAAADAYAAAPAGMVIEAPGDLRAVVNGDVAAIRGTEIDSLANWAEDVLVDQHVPRHHPQLGDCPEGPLLAALRLFRLLPAGLRTLTGHSLGGQLAVLLAGLLAAEERPPALVVTWDAPKAGGPDLAALLVKIPVRQYRFRGSVVTDWPLFAYQHVREPLIPVGVWTTDLVAAHSIERARAWMEAQA